VSLLSPLPGAPRFAPIPLRFFDYYSIQIISSVEYYAECSTWNIFQNVAQAPPLRVALWAIGAPLGAVLARLGMLALGTSQLLAPRSEDEVSKHSRTVRVFHSCLLHDSWQSPPQHAVNAIHFLNRRLLSFPHEHVAQRRKDPTDGAAMNAHIRSTQVAERFVYPVRYSLTYIPRVLAVASGVRYGKAELEWHIEPWHARPPSIQLNARKVVDGIPALFDQLENSVEPALTGGNFEGGARNQSECAQSRNVSQIQVLELPVVRNV